jgi:hypothetical protein
MLKLAFTFFFSALFLFLQAQSTTISNASSNVQIVIDSSSNIAEHITTPVYDGAIFPARFGRIFSASSFTPAKEDVEKAEASIARDLKKLNKALVHQSSTPIIHKNLDMYQRQYLGYVDENGDHIIYINCFWMGDYDGTWLNKIIRHYDGGSFYWQVRYNLDKGILFGLKVNIV